MKTLLAALVLSLAPTLALAMGCSSGHGQTSSACAAGQSYDAATGTCVSQPTT